MQSDGDKKRAREILSSPDALHYMSSEESYEDEAVEPRPRTTKDQKAFMGEEQTEEY